ncbi:restriction endonuclease, partial [Paenibacillus taichungensis]
IIKQKIIEVSDFIKVLRITLGNVREYLKGEEETGVSKNILLMMRNRHAYLPEVYQFIVSNSSLTMKDFSSSISFNYLYWKSILHNLEEVSGSFQKGTSLEKLVQYFICTVPGLKITDVRAIKGRAEVDIYCCNVSFDSCLWKLGALVLIECKNRKNKVTVSDVRNLVPTMEAKGIHGAMIFSRTGFTSVALKEIKYQLSGGKMIVPISIKEMEEIDESKGAYDLIREKIEQFDRIIENNSDNLYF